MIRLICIDVDGTLIGTSGIVPPAVWAAAERVRARGIRLAICSGRPCFGDARGYALRLDPDGWHVFQNGASVVHPSSGESRSTRIVPELVSRLVTRARETGRILELYSDVGYAVESIHLRARQHADLLGVPFVATPFEHLAGPIVRMQWLLARDEASAVLRELEPGLEGSASTSPLMTDTSFINMTTAGVNKATAVRALADEYGISLPDVMFVGDGENDVGAMQSIGFPVAMANAEQSVKDIAHRTVAHVDEAGLAEAMELVLASPDLAPTV